MIPMVNFQVQPEPTILATMELRLTIRLSLALILAACLASAHNQNKKSKVVSTVLNTKWSNTPLVLEASEVLAEEDNEYFWDFLDYLSDRQSIDLVRLTPQEIYENVISFASRSVFLTTILIGWEGATTLNIKKDIHHNYVQHNVQIVTLRIMQCLVSRFILCYAECRRVSLCW
jgi:hypothetical protein